MQKLMLETIERIINQKLENFRLKLSAWVSPNVA
jgi:hypothetical protein